MTCEVDVEDGTVRVRGEMTIYHAQSLKEPWLAAVAAQASDCRLDLSGVSEFDTAGLQLLLLARRACLARQASFELTERSAAVQETLELLQMDPSLAAGPGEAAGGST